MTDTETWARDLLARAADTIPAGPPPALPACPPHRPWWPVLAAAAAVTIAIAFAFSVDNPSPTAEPARPTSSPKQLSPFDVPLTFGMTGEEARAALESAGFDVTVRDEPTCDEAWGRAMGTRWSGSGHVELTVAVENPSGRCPQRGDPDRVTAWQLIDLATGRGPGPDRAPACCPAAVLREIKQASTHFVPTDGIFDIPPVLVVQPVLQGFEMVIGTEMAHKVIPLVRATVEMQAGRVTDVRRGRFSVDPEPPDESEQTRADPDGAGRRFLEFATGSADTLPLDTPVRLYLGNTYVKTISSSEGETRSSWNVCAPSGGISCPVSALFVLDNYQGQLAWTGHPSQTDFCPDTLEPGPPDDTGGSYAVVLSPPEPGSCAQSFEVQVWVNDAGQTVAVNLLLGTP